MWAALFVVTVTALFWAAVIEQRSRRARFALAVAVGSSWAVVATAPAMGLLPILLVVTAAVSVYLVPVQVALTIVALNTVVLAASAAIPGAAGEIPLMVGFYLLIQFATVFGSVSLLREQRMRRELTETHVDLRAATVLLAESARTAERLRISRDLHDLIGHQLTVLALELEAARHRDGDGAHEHVERAAGVARALLSDVRNTVGSCAPNHAISRTPCTGWRTTSPAWTCRSPSIPKCGWGTRKSSPSCGRCRRSSPTPSATPTPANSGSP